MFCDLPHEPVACNPAPENAVSWLGCRIAGNINEALDLWAGNLAMPPLPEGDFTAFLDTGGYGAATRSDHCMRGVFGGSLPGR